MPLSSMLQSGTYLIENTHQVWKLYILYGTFDSATDYTPKKSTSSYVQPLENPSLDFHYMATQVKNLSTHIWN